MKPADQTPMQPSSLSEHLAENPGRLLDMVLDKLRLKNDTALARMLGVTPSIISKIRHRKLPVSAPILVRILEETQLHIRELHQSVACWSPPEQAASDQVLPDWTRGLNIYTAHILLKQGYGSRSEVQSALERDEPMSRIGKARRKELRQWLGIEAKPKRWPARSAECKAQPAQACLPKQAASTPASVGHSPLSAQLVEHPAELLDAVIDKLHLKNDAALARKLGIPAPNICQMRWRNRPVGAAILVYMLEATQLHIRELHRLVQSRLSPKTIIGAGGQEISQTAAVTERPAPTHSGSIKQSGCRV